MYNIIYYITINCNSIYYVILHHNILYYIILYNIPLSVPYYIFMLYHIILYCIILYCMLYYTIRAVTQTGSMPFCNNPVKEINIIHSYIKSFLPSHQVISYITLHDSQHNYQYIRTYFLSSLFAVSGWNSTWVATLLPGLWSF